LNSSFKLWVLAARPKTLPAGAAPVILGLALSIALGEEIKPLLSFLTLACALGLQISSNLINDYYDGIRGTDDSNRLGPDRATAQGLISPATMKKAFLLTLTTSFIMGLYLMITCGVPIVIIGISSLFFAWAYTGGPFPLSYFGLGEVFAFIFFGPVAVWGTYYIQSGKISYPLPVMLAGAALGFLSSALMGVNNLRDTDQDRIKNKVTLSTLVGQSAMRKIILLFVAASLSCLCLSLYKLTNSHISSFLPLLVFLLFYKTWQQVISTAHGRELNNTLASIGKYLFLSSLASSLVLIIHEVLQR
jgi:1,4-dihydroxy-2-naphthoate octaprenyltransferase